MMNSEHIEQKPRGSDRRQNSGSRRYGLRQAMCGDRRVTDRRSPGLIAA